MAASVLSACRSVEPTDGVPPFVEFYDTPSSVGLEAGREVIVRPLFAREAWDESSWRVKVLLPFVVVREEPVKQIYQVLGVFHYRNRSKATGGEDTDWMLFPFLYGGDDPEEGPYFAFFPFGGKLKGLLAQDEVDFWVFPIYWRQRDEDRVSTHWVWPLGNVVEGGGWSGWRVMPFYADYEWRTEDGTVRSRRRTIAWPFWIKNQEWQQEDPTEVFFSFPFYGYRENGRIRTETFVWPFYVQAHDKKKPEEDIRGGFLFPWRIGEDHVDIWPFWGSKQEINREGLPGTDRDRYRQYAVWPVQRYDWGRDHREETSRFWLLPFFWSYDYRSLVESDDSRARWKLWPLVGWREDGDEVGLDVLSPWWNYREDFRRMYERWFSIFRYRSRTSYWGWELLWGTLYFGSGERKSGEPTQSLFSVLGGLIELGTREGEAGDEAVVRLLWIPWW